MCYSHRSIQETDRNECGIKLMEYFSLHIIIIIATFSLCCLFPLQIVPVSFHFISNCLPIPSPFSELNWILFALSPSTDITKRGNLKFGDKCETTDDCGFRDSVCDPKKKSCQCVPEFPITNHMDKCGKGEGKRVTIESLESGREQTKQDKTNENDQLIALINCVNCVSRHLVINCNPSRPSSPPSRGGHQRNVLLQRAVWDGELPNGVPRPEMHLSVRDDADCEQGWHHRMSEWVFDQAGRQHHTAATWLIDHFPTVYSMSVWKCHFPSLLLLPPFSLFCVEHLTPNQRQERTVAFPDVRGSGDDYDSGGYGADVHHHLCRAASVQSVSDAHVLLIVINYLSSTVAA